MKTLALVIFALLAPLTALAQGGMGPGPGTVHSTGGGGGGGYLGLGDLDTYAVYAGLRAYSAAIVAAGTQPLVNVSRVSDSHTCDILVSGTGYLGNTANCSTGGDNGAAAATFCATTCNVPILYDQTGGGHNFVPTGGNVTLSLSDTSLAFNGSAGLRINSMPAVAQPLSFSSVSKRTSGTSSSTVMNAPAIIVRYEAATELVEFAGVAHFSVAAESTWHTSNVTFNGTSSIVNLDMVSTSSLNLSTGAIGSGEMLGIGDNGGGGERLTGNIREIAISASNQNATMLNNVALQQHAAYGGF